jgi:hypothetical protein
VQFAFSSTLKTLNFLFSYFAGKNYFLVDTHA